MISAILKILTGIVAVAALAFAATQVDGFPGSSASAVKKLQRNAEAALGPDAQWAQVEMVGQTAILTGSAPEEAQIADARARVARADGGGGLILGGVTMIDARGLTVAGKPETPEETVMEAPAPEARTEEPPADDIVIAAAEPAEDDPVEDADAEAPETIGDLIASAETEVTAAQPEATAATPETAPADGGPPTPSLAPIKKAPTPKDCYEEIEAVATARKISFVSAKVELDEPTRAQLRRMSLAIMDCPGARVAIIGHTDSSGSNTRNLELSTNRAAAVRAYLLYMGAPADRISARGAGARNPVASNRTPEGRARNRRIEIVVTRAGE